VHVTFFLPAIHDRPTGGNVFNRRLIEGLRRHTDTTVEAVPWPDGAPPTLPLPPSAVVVIDSLLATRPDGLDALRTAHPDTPLVLLAHYLHCVDPHEQDAPAADTERAVLRRIDGAVAPSAYAKRALSSQGLPAARVEVVRPGLDDAYRAPVAERSAGRPPRLLTVASLLPGKGLPLLLDVLGRLRDRDWTWTLAGDDTLDPDFADAVRDRRRALGLTDRTRLLGPVAPDTLRDHYDRADVFVLPSRFETCSLATREAMARGCPVVAFDAGGLAENLGDAPAGRLVPPGNREALAGTLRSLLADAEQRRRMGRAARRRSRAFPTWADTTRQFHDALRGLRGAAGT